MKKYPVYFLDADQTLFDFKKSEAESIVKCFESYQITCTEKEILCYHRNNDALWKALERGEVDQHELRVLRFINTFHELDIHENPAEASARYSKFLSECAYLLPDAEKVCRKLAETSVLYLTTNGISDIQRGRFYRSPLVPYFKDIYISEELGVSKPNPAYFESAVSKACCQKSDILVVGDSLSSDIKGAAAAGLDSCWFNENDRLSSIGVQSTYIIRRLTELL